MQPRLPLLFAGVLFVSGLSAQTYCSPSFLNGCSLWRNLTVDIGSINWVAGSDCFVSDFTSLSTVVTPGVAEPMVVSSGNWTGCAVWVDLNQNTAFEDSENFFHQYVGGDPSYTYNFTITLPPGTPAGSYRMRVVAGWGTDGFTPGSINGFGPCGAYQYGNFNDFTVVVSGPTGIEATTASPLRIHPNPTNGLVTLSLDAADALERVLVCALDGRVLLDLPIAARTGPVMVDLAALPLGAYLLTGFSSATTWTTRLVRD